MNTGMMRVAQAGIAALVGVALFVVIGHSAFGLGYPALQLLHRELALRLRHRGQRAGHPGPGAARREGRLGWALIGSGLLCWAIGDSYWSIAYVNAAAPPFPSADDIFYLLGYPLVLGGMLAYVHERMGKRSILVWTDVTMGALCVAAIGTSLLLDFVLTNTTGTPDQVAVAVAYPLFDVATIAVADRRLRADRLAARSGPWAGHPRPRQHGDRGCDLHLPVGRWHLHGQRLVPLPLAPRDRPDRARRGPAVPEAARAAGGRGLADVRVAGRLRAGDLRPDEPPASGHEPADRGDPDRRDPGGDRGADHPHLQAEPASGGRARDRLPDRPGQPGKAALRPRPLLHGERPEPSPARHPRPRRLQGLQRRLRPPGGRQPADPPRPPARRRGRVYGTRLPDGRRRVRADRPRRGSAGPGGDRGRGSRPQRARRRLPGHLFGRLGRDPP